MQPIFDTVAIVGPGLVGGSLGMALRRRGVGRRVIGIGRRQSSLRTAIEVGAVDQATLDLHEGVQDAELVVLAVPISAFEKLMGNVAASMRKGAILTDVASTKGQVIQTVTMALKDREDLVYVPTHPMAGSERHGAANAREGLFEGSVCILTPLPETPQVPLERVRALWESVGAAVHEMDTAAHDRLVARISHLPHLAVAALLQTIDEAEGELAGGGLMDTTRIASGDPALWRDICKSNPCQIARAIESYTQVLQRIRAMIQGGRFDEIESFLSEAKRRRDDLSGGTPKERIENSQSRI